MIALVDNRGHVRREAAGACFASSGLGSRLISPQLLLSGLYPPSGDTELLIMLSSYDRFTFPRTKAGGANRTQKAEEWFAAVNTIPHIWILLPWFIYLARKKNPATSLNTTPLRFYRSFSAIDVA